MNSDELLSVKLQHANLELDYLRSELIRMRKLILINTKDNLNGKDCWPKWVTDELFPGRWSKGLSR